MNPYVYLGGAVVFLLACGGAYVKGRTDGDAITRSEYAARDLQASEEARIAERGLSAKDRAQERRWQSAFSDAQTKYQRTLDANHTALLTADAVRLRDPFTKPEACSGGTSQAAANTIAANSGGTELSDTLARFLKSEASRADAVVLKLNLCIDTLESERR